MSYEKLKATDSDLLDRIHGTLAVFFFFLSLLLLYLSFRLVLEYAKCIHAPSIISQTMFSGAVSLKCRHLRQVAKNGKQAPGTKSSGQEKQSKGKDFRNAKRKDRSIEEQPLEIIDDGEGENDAV